MKIFFIYILFSESSNMYYVGYTSNMEMRLDQHNDSNHNTFTSKHRPWNLAACFKLDGSEADAMKIEKFIKKQKSRKFIEKIMDEATVLEGILAPLVRVPMLRD